MVSCSRRAILSVLALIAVAEFGVVEIDESSGHSALSAYRLLVGHRCVVYSNGGHLCVLRTSGKSMGIWHGGTRCFAASEHSKALFRLVAGIWLARHHRHSRLLTFHCRRNWLSRLDRYYSRHGNSSGFDCRN